MLDICFLVETDWQLLVTFHFENAQITETLGRDMQLLQKYG